MRSRRWIVVLALGLGAVSGLEISCFNPPSDDVSFSCDPEEAPKCPEGYTCERDGCCHRNGSDVDAKLGACALGGDAGETTGSMGSSGSDSTGSSTDGGSSTGTGTDSSTT